jgi:hypothetical protein
MMRSAIACAVLRRAASASNSNRSSSLLREEAVTIGDILTLRTFDPGH